MTAPRSAPTPVRLVDFPLQLFDAALEQWEGMLREYRLRGMAGEVQSYRDEEIGRAGRALALVSDAASAAGAAGHPLEIHVPTPGDFAVLQAILDDARRLAFAEQLLVLPSLPEIVAFRNWLCDEVAEQGAGATPRPWRLETFDDDLTGTASAVWDQLPVPAPESAWLVGDDHHRILAASPAALTLLGWPADGLVGQRLLAVVPHHLREAHIAGFTRAVVTGEGPLLGQRLALHALTRDGRQVPVTLTLTRHPARAGRQVFLARLEGRIDGPAA